MRGAHPVAEVRAAEAVLLARLPEGALMARAAAGLAAAVVGFLGGARGRRVLLLVGPGDNGGDALWAGASLARRGAAVWAVPAAGRLHPAGLAALRRAGGRVVEPDDVGAALTGLRDRGLSLDVVVDGVVGIGGRPGLDPGVVRLLALLEGVPVVAVDVPSGVDVDTGETPGPHVRADLTVTFGTHKPAHLVDPAAAACGAVHLVDLGLALPEPALTSYCAADVAALLPVPAPDAHKYTRGVVGVRAGSPQYPGAALLCVAGAASGLAGMVRYVGPDAVADRVRTAFPEVVGAGRVQAWCVGAGGGEGARDALAATLADAVADAVADADADADADPDAGAGDPVPVVVDADALAHLADQDPGHLAALAGRLVLTPHAGELARLLGTDRQAVESAPLRHVREAARRLDAVVLLKGRRTLVADPGGRVRSNPTGTPWLATAGAGDVLTGLVAALLAARLEPFDAAAVGAWLHGAAAGTASAGGPLVAGDVAHALPSVVRDLRSEVGGSTHD
ncbi:NAD(P)H-hydrate dehydratase [Nocardioides solisilvae]|uniref:NAD(P)H-hydrate dehydratase n=1 Tax=Nocardioides solisilvae TaxID=1542435 RepID=UPI001950B77B|nr:NAD(P)H-hydrate dehydratase [Nocardioides solisilvae]